MHVGSKERDEARTGHTYPRALSPQGKVWDWEFSSAISLPRNMQKKRPNIKNFLLNFRFLVFKIARRA